MGFEKKKGESGLAPLVALVMMILMLGLKATCCRGAHVLVKSNATYECKGGNGRLDGCRIAENLELENLDFLMMSSNVFRILQGEGGSGNHVTGTTNDAD
ncbi:hypothetical protein COLO4_37977 [Corchorus olitorius]|uniref:Uncharacterized protein n=1 Tax=Corchorus olitorius TaxID=93759 RepID=A0A1R3FXQ6_9ROSI|nr:hypothetical protein COLO4_37977 [Corchorus olitorius]